MARKILEAYESEYVEMIDFIDKFPDLQETPAQFQERCAQIALKCFWREMGVDQAPDAATNDGAFTRVFNQLMGDAK